MQPINPVETMTSLNEVFKDGKIIWHASHERITVKAMREACKYFDQE